MLLFKNIKKATLQNFEKILPLFIFLFLISQFLKSTIKLIIDADLLL